MTTSTATQAGDSIDGSLGEAGAGTTPNGVHLNVVLATRGTPTCAAVMGVLANARDGFTPFLACLGRGNLVRPATVVINRAPMTSDTDKRMMWGAAQLGIGQAVLDAVCDRWIDSRNVLDMVLLAIVSLRPEAEDQTEVRRACRAAMRAAVGAAIAPEDPRQAIARLIEGHEHAHNDFYDGS